jgi:hypothetical protein
VFVQAAVYGIIVYAMIGFEWTAAKFFWYLFFMYFTLLYFTFYGMMSVAVTPNHHIAAIISSSFYGLWNLFSGFIVPRTVSISRFNLMCKTFTNSFLVLINLLGQQTEDSCMVEMVLLGMSCSLDLVWVGCFSIWRYKGRARGNWCHSGRFCERLFRIQA